MFGDQLRCKICSQYAPDHCLCGESITNPAVKATMAAARAAYENDVVAEYGQKAIKGSPHYEVEFIAREWRTFWRAWQAATAHSDVTIRDLRVQKAELESELAERSQEQTTAPAEFLEISRLLHTQNNRVTDAPLFIVQRKRSYVTEEGYNNDRFEWRETKSGDHIEADPLQAKRLELLHRNGRYAKGWKRYSVFDLWEFVTACFTEQGCKDYLVRNGHNLGETRIYAEGSYRNEEYRAVRNWLMSLTPAPIKEKADAAHC